MSGWLKKLDVWETIADDGERVVELMSPNPGYGPYTPEWTVKLNMEEVKILESILNRILVRYNRDK